MIDTPTSPIRSGMGDQRKQLILSFIHEYRRVKGISPTYQDIATGIGYTSEGTAYTLTEELVREGWLKRVAPGARTLVPVHDAATPYTTITDPGLKDIAKKQRNLRILRRM